MMTKNDKFIFEKARNKVKTIKNFYSHLILFFAGSIFLLAIKADVVEWVSEKSGNSDEEFLNWVDWNIWAVLIIWGVVLAIVGFKTFSFPYMKKWEERQISKILERNNS